jgi:hypothetical protein
MAPERACATPPELWTTPLLYSTDILLPAGRSLTLYVNATSTGDSPQALGVPTASNVAAAASTTAKCRSILMSLSSQCAAPIARLV